MSRFVLPIVALICFVMFSVRWCAADDASEFKLNEDVPGYIEKVEMITLPHPYGRAYPSDHSLELKAGRKVTITAIALGADRRVFVRIYDKTNAVVGESEYKLKLAKIEFTEPAYTGPYRIEVCSDRVGNYTLRVDDEVENEESIRAKIDRLKQELAKEEQKLKELKEKRKQ